MKRRQERYQDIVEKLFEEIRSHWDDLPLVNRLLVELGRIYDPLLGGPVVEPSMHRRIMEQLQAGGAEEARRLLEQCVESHHRFERLKQEREAAFRSEE